LVLSCDRIGSGESNANQFLAKEYESDINVEKAIEIALETICKTLDSANPAPEKIEICILKKSSLSDALVVKELSIEELKVELKKKEEKDKSKQQHQHHK
jgi:20S proteasome alpha/beta subunit